MRLTDVLLLACGTRDPAVAVASDSDKAMQVHQPSRSAAGAAAADQIAAVDVLFFSLEADPTAALLVFVHPCDTDDAGEAVVCDA